MKPPPFLLSVTLLFWGWQSDLVLPGALMAVILESALVFRTRWDLSEDDFSKTWSFCSLVLLSAVVYSFTNNEGPSSFATMFDDLSASNQRTATVASARTAAQVIRWLPMIFFPFLAAQTFSTRESIPLTTLSLILQRRWRKAKQLGQPLPPARGFNVGYPYFCAALLSASFHPSEDTSFFWGFCALLMWVLWTQRSRRYGIAVWIVLLAAAGTAGYFGQRSMAGAQAYLTNHLSAQWLANFIRRADDPFQNRTSLGLVGRLKMSDSIVIRLQPETPKNVPAYLREASYRLYRGSTWYSGSSRDYIDSIAEEQPVPSGNWPLLSDKRTASRLNIACYLDGFDKGSPAGLLPLPSGTARLEKLAAYTVDRYAAGSVMAHGPGLVLFDAHYGPGATFDLPSGFGTVTNLRGRRLYEESGLGRFEPHGDWASSNDPPVFVYSYTNEDLAVTPLEAAALDAVVDELKLKGRDHGETLRVLQQFFDSKFKYSMWQSAPRSSSNGQTPLARFLLETHSGHCEYFATATVLLLRRVGIPARYATGYSVHEESGDGYVVRLSDAHAWTLVWDETHKVWNDFDTTPAIWVEAEKKNRSPLRWLKDAWSRFTFEFAKLRNGQGNIRGYLLWIIVPGMVLLLGQIVFRRGRKRRKDKKSDADFLAIWPGLDSDFYQLEKKIAARGVPRSDAEPLNLWLQRVEKSPGMETLREPLRELIKLHYRHRFDPHGLNAAEREKLKAETKRCLELLAQSRSGNS